ncbi:MAG TPA: class II aldolase and adducin N-terminal domain-containing protein [Paracoccaceae bacterium]|nr:class II aldolase and adducin N-terminal domain-containing protein [Paracoccaceae bacterium]
MTVTRLNPKHNLGEQRADLAAAFRWVARLNMHEGVANHFSLAVNEDGTQFLMNPNQVHFALVKASDLLLLDANDPETMRRPDAPDPTAWGLHGTIHRRLPHARCAMHVHAVHATVLACLQDSRLPPLDQNCAMFFNRVAIDTDYGGLAFEAEAARVCTLLADPAKQVLVMGNHGVMVVGSTVAEALNRLYYFERAAETYIKALWTGRPLRLLPDHVAESVARDIEVYPEAAEKLMIAVHGILQRDGEDYRD